MIKSHDFLKGTIMLLCDEKIGKSYIVEEIQLPKNIEKRLEALGMTQGSRITVINGKSHGILIVKIRGTRFALGKNITKNIIVREES